MSYVYAGLRMALRTVETTHNTALFTNVCQKLHQATGDHTYSTDSEEVVTFVSTTNRKAAILVRGGGGGRGGGWSPPDPGPVPLLHYCIIVGFVV